MGSRSRGNGRAEHVKAGKGAPTAKAPQNRAAPEPAGPPKSTIVVWPVGFTAAISQHRAVAGACLDLYFMLEGGAQAVIRMPAGTWPNISTEVAALLERVPPDMDAAARAAAAGLHLPAGVDVDAEAAGIQHLKEGPPK